MALQRRLKVLDSGTESETGGEAPTLKVAFASTDMKHVDQHFGSAQSFVVYAVSPDETRMVEAIQFSPTACDGDENKLPAKLDALDGCAAVYVRAVGHSAIGQLLARGIQPFKVPAGASVDDTLAALRVEMRERPRSWITRALDRRKAPDRFDTMEAEGWCE